MKIKEGFKLRSICGVYVVTASGPTQVNFNKLISLNDTAAYLWQEIEGKEFSVKDLSDLLFDKYEIDRETADRDSEAIASKWIEVGIVEE